MRPDLRLFWRGKKKKDSPGMGVRECVVGKFQGTVLKDVFLSCVCRRRHKSPFPGVTRERAVPSCDFLCTVSGSAGVCR